MPAYLVQISPTIPSRQLPDAADSFVVFTQNESAAREVVGSLYAGDATALINSAQTTVTEVVAGADFEGWVLRIIITNPAGAVAHDVSVTGAPADTFTDIGAAMKVALEAEDGLSGLVYASGTLVVASIANNIGDHTVAVDFSPPAGSVFIEPVSLDSVINVITSGGDPPDPLVVTFHATHAVPAVFARLRV